MENESSEGDAGGSAPAATAEQGPTQTPDQAARADLIQWCTEHGLPVPPPPTADRRTSVR